MTEPFIKTRLPNPKRFVNDDLGVTDIEAVAEISSAAGATLVVDSTFATPVASKPLSLGADLVVQSLTKYICGHGDALGESSAAE